MGYTTDFVGCFKLSKPLTPEQTAYLKKFNYTRRMKRDPSIAATLPDPERIAVGLDIGPEACFFVGGTGFAGQDDDKSVVNHNEQPEGQPGLWCKWVPNDTGEYIGWDGCEKFYDEIVWLNYIIKNFLKPWKLKLNGVVRYQGERNDDFGSIVVIDNKIWDEKGLKSRATYPKVMPRHSTLFYGDKRGLLDTTAKLSRRYKAKLT